VYEAHSFLFDEDEQEQEVEIPYEESLAVKNKLALKKLLTLRKEKRKTVIREEVVEIRVSFSETRPFRPTGTPPEEQNHPKCDPPENCWKKPRNKAGDMAYRLKQGEDTRKRWQNPDFRNKMKEIYKNRPPLSQEVIEKRGESHKKYKGFVSEWEDLLKTGWTKKEISIKYEVPYSTLKRYLNTYKKNPR